MRRALAGIGARATAHAVEPPRVAVHATPAVRPGARRIAPPDVTAGHVAGTLAPGPARSAAPVVRASPRGVAALPTPVARAAAALATAVRRAALLRPAGARGPGRGATAVLRVQRRERVPWLHLPRPRLAAAWEAAQRAHGAADGPLSLVGVYGPLPLAAVAEVALEPDGRVAVTLAPRRGAAATGDLALARSDPGGRLLRCDLPYPGEVGPVRRTR